MDTENEKITNASGEVKNFSEAISTQEKTVCEQPNLPLTEEAQAKFDWCCETLENHKRSIPNVAKAIAIIDREKYYANYEDCDYKNADDFIHEVFEFERTYIYRMKKFGYWLLKKDFPEGHEPSETSVRGMFQNGYTDDDREKIYRKAQENCFNRRKKDTKSSQESKGSDEMSESGGGGDSMSDGDQGSDSGEPRTTSDFEDEIRQIVPEAKDIRKAIEDFRNESGRIYFPLLDNKSYPKDTSFLAILKENADKFTTTGIVLECFKIYKAATKMTVVDEETEQSIRELIRKLIKETEAEMNKLLQNPAAITENNEN